MSTTASESDPFFQLLSEALRAGPGSEQWTEAVNKLRDGGVEGADEYRLIIRAREDLEKGRDFRSVSAGPKFTRKVLDAVDEEGRRRSGVPTATIVAVISAIVIIGVVAAVVVMMRGGAGYDPKQAAFERLDAMAFSNDVTSLHFSQDHEAFPSDWKAIGSLRTNVHEGLSVPPAKGDGKSMAGGGIVWSTPLPADVPIMVEAEVAGASDESKTIVHVFVSDSFEFSPDRGVSPREVVAVWQGTRNSAEANGSVQGQASTSSAKATIRMSSDLVSISVDGHRIYGGPHNLQPGSPRYVGVRFIRPAGDTTPSPDLKSIEIFQAGTK